MLGTTDERNLILCRIDDMKIGRACWHYAKYIFYLSTDIQYQMGHPKKFGYHNRQSFALEVLDEVELSLYSNFQLEFLNKKTLQTF
jgi:hypothetical protein